jgi:hypothetical protein
VSFVSFECFECFVVKAYVSKCWRDAKCLIR